MGFHLTISRRHHSYVDITRFYRRIILSSSVFVPFFDSINGFFHLQVGGALLWASLAHAPRRVLMVSSSPPDPALTAAAAANGTTGAAAAAAAAASQEEDQEEEDDEGAQRVAAYKKLGLGACTVADLEVLLPRMELHSFCTSSVYSTCDLDMCA